MRHIDEHQLQQWLERWFHKHTPYYSIDATLPYSELIHYEFIHDDDHPNATITTIFNIGELARDVCAEILLPNLKLQG